MASSAAAISFRNGWIERPIRNVPSTRKTFMGGAEKMGLTLSLRDERSSLCTEMRDDLFRELPRDPVALPQVPLRRLPEVFDGSESGLLQGPRPAGPNSPKLKQLAHRSILLHAGRFEAVHTGLKVLVVRGILEGAPPGGLAARPAAAPIPARWSAP